MKRRKITQNPAPAALFGAMISALTGEAMLLFRTGCTAVLAVLSAIVILTERDVSSGCVGVRYIYAPWVEYPVMTFVIVCIGTVLLDFAVRLSDTVSDRGK